MTVLLKQLDFSIATISDAVVAFWQCVNQHHVIVFSGSMGAGKTTFIHHLCALLQVEDRVSSPTFALINEYHFPVNGSDGLIYHMDWYRLNNTAEAIYAGIEDCLRQARGQTWCFVEWPEKAPDLLPGTYIRVDIATLSPADRQMNISLIEPG
jgi:tRNA threonylcarbamoyladenosine biosynthesis protein TsaE